MGLEFFAYLMSGGSAEVEPRKQSLRGIVILAAVDWDDHQQRPHHLARAWAESIGLPTIFIENTGARPVRFSDWRRILKRLKRLRTSAGAKDPESPFLKVLSPVLIPGVSGAIGRINVLLLASRLRRHLRTLNLGPDETALVIYLPTPIAVGLSTQLPWRLCIYDTVADVISEKRYLSQWEHQLLVKANRLVSASRTLQAAYENRTGRQVRYIPDGVVVRPVEIAMPDEVSLLYLGGIDQRLDFDLLHYLASGHPDWKLVLFGDTRKDLRDLLTLPNVIHLPRRSAYDEIWPIVASASVGLVPYRRTPYTDGMHPAKLQEYLLAGLPVVATATSEMGLIVSEYGKGFIYTAPDPQGFADAVGRALLEDSLPMRERRNRAAKERSWNHVAQEFLA